MTNEAGYEVSILQNELFCNIELLALPGRVLSGLIGMAFWGYFLSMKILST